MTNAIQPYQPLYLSEKLVGWTLPDLNKIEARKQKIADTTRMTKLLHAISDPHYRSEDSKIHAQGLQILLDAKAEPNRYYYPHPDAFPNYRRKKEPTPEPVIDEPPYGFTSKEIDLSEPHFFGRTQIKSKPTLRDLAKLNLTGLSLELIDVLNERKSSQVQVPLQAGLEIPLQYTQNPNIMQEKRVIVTDIDGGDGPKPGVYEIKYE